ncbi:MAG: polysulfide reductase NrfD [Gammaproteobacteria bacterium]|nr:polysulfide reductase NrfD [Gammaproteobacteria bacterium]
MSVRPAHQTNWDFRAAANFIFGGSGSGLMLAAALLALIGEHAVAYALLAALFVVAGLLMVWLEIGRPLRFTNVFLKPGKSWMTREAYLATALVPLGALAYFLASRPLLLAAALFAAAFLYAQARILKASKGIPAWRVAEIVPLVVATGLTEGVAIVLILSPLSSSETHPVPSLWIWIAAGLLVLFRGVAWVRYWRRLCTGAPSSTITALEPVNAMLLILGLTLPLLLVIAGIWSSGYQVYIALATGLFMLLPGWICKFSIITRAAFTQGYAIPHSPARGGGIAGPGAKPGWRIPQ